MEHAIPIKMENGTIGIVKWSSDQQVLIGTVPLHDGSKFDMTAVVEWTEAGGRRTQHTLLSVLLETERKERDDNEGYNL